MDCYSWRVLLHIAVPLLLCCFLLDAHALGSDQVWRTGLCVANKPTMLDISTQPPAVAWLPCALRKAVQSLCLSSCSAGCTTSLLRAFTGKNAANKVRCAASQGTWGAAGVPAPRSGLPWVPWVFAAADASRSPHSLSAKERFRLTTVYSLCSHSSVIFTPSPSMIKSSRNEFKGLGL